MEDLPDTNRTCGDRRCVQYSQYAIVTSIDLFGAIIVETH